MSILICAPVTGRTHQIRVHCQFLGNPIVFDPLYNSTAWGDSKGKGVHDLKDDKKEEVIDKLVLVRRTRIVGMLSLVSAFNLSKSA